MTAGGVIKVGLVALIGIIIGVGVHGCKESKDYYDRGSARLDKREHDSAISDLDKAIEFNPQLAVAYGDRALIYFVRKDYDKTWENIRKQESLGLEARPEFLKALQKASGRRK